MILVAGHACVVLSTRPSSGGSGGEVVGCGGVVSDVGLALHRLGVAPVRLVARVGDDALGRRLKEIYETAGPGLGNGLVTVPGGTTGWAVVSGLDGAADAEHTGVNEGFAAVDLGPEQFRDCRHLHLGNLALLRSAYADGGKTLASILAAAQDAGLTTSVEVSGPRTATQDGPTQDGPKWDTVFRTFLPACDLLTTTVGGLRALLNEGDTVGPQELAERMLRRGAGGVVMGVAPCGLYCRTKKDTSSWAPRGWSSVDHREPPTHEQTPTRPASSHAAIAGLLAGLYQGLPPAEALKAACATAAACDRSPTGPLGLPRWSDLPTRATP